MSAPESQECLVHIVEDDAAIRRALRRMIMRHGYEAIEHASGEAFMDGFDPDRIGCVIVDM
ncbi:response regulator receiver protein [Dinoroseobacter shibae DFL 12 = DSM 16493]|jgi:FixJ family two-component response regulator|uniref:Response regulator receiver protein n=1 Tax=Dinoroseobacter shibae (strain DSM 16493 / NCIMB 14021 / DFL 12) TaxID=398580 RepID=A8LNV2_DINSH|nr:MULTISPECIES: response regulator [Dinoroseobacter]ABV92260.1 response regulator receiver protein [Dinoroseobacter shibae DFL 12 = DSM 16493]MDD9717464.1 response regulator [Dinoroseobacter sp. PD6]URF47214.1 response regulator [Dinoroseobacter shibae]URF51525.1 response regulator [Dinoroseobacter shibae]